MVMIKIDGVELEQGSAAHIAAIQAGANRQVAEMQAKLDAATAATDAAKARADKAELKATPEAIEAEVTSRLKLRADASKLLPADYKFDGKSAEQVRTDAVAAKGVKVEGKSAAYIDARFDILLEESAEPVKAVYVGKLDEKDAPGRPETDVEFSARMRTDSLAQQPLFSGGK